MRYLLLLIFLLIACRGGEERGEQIIYIGWEPGEVGQLLLLDAVTGASEALTAVPGGVVDFAVSAGGQIAFAAARDDQRSSDLWLAGAGEPAAMLLDCDGSFCRGPVWEPGGERLIFERWMARDARESARLWWLELSTGATRPLIDDPTAAGRLARFSADGRWLSFLDPVSQAMRIIELATGRLIVIPSQAGEPAAWHPARPLVLIPSVEFVAERGARQLLLLDVAAGGQPVNLTDNGSVDDSAPAWSPDGNSIAVARGVARTAVGRQLYVVRAGGGEARALTSDPGGQHIRPRWSPDGTRLLYQRFPIPDDGLPELWLIDVTTGEMQLLAKPGLAPEWLPAGE